MLTRSGSLLFFGSDLLLCSGMSFLVLAYLVDCASWSLNVLDSPLGISLNVAIFVFVGTEVFRVILMSVANYRYPFRVTPVFLLGFTGVAGARVATAVTGL